MSRYARTNLQTYTYFHICVRGNNGQPIFLDDQDRTRYLSLFEKYRSRYDIQCFAYCLMPNHVHLLTLIPSIQKLSKTMHALQVAYVVYFNKRHNRRGHLFGGRFISWLVKNEHHAISAKEYIEDNPVRANLVRVSTDYPWGSAAGDTSAVTLSKLMT